MNSGFDVVGEARQSFVHRVVHHFVNQVVQSHLTSRADVHGGTLAHGFHATQYFYGVSGILAIRLVVAILPIFLGEFLNRRFERFVVLGSRSGGRRGFFRGHPAPFTGNTHSSARCRSLRRLAWKLSYPLDNSYLPIISTI